MSKGKKYICYGLIFNALAFLSREFNLLPDFFEGFTTGSALVLLFYGIYSESHDIAKFKSNKMNLVKNIVRK